MKSKRVEWVDIAKLIGMFAIYLGHFGTAAGLSYPFVFSFHVPLFFFISGCVSNYERDCSVKEYLLKKFKRILIPFYGFASLSIIINVVLNDADLGDIKQWLWLVIKGCIRNTFFASGLWFLSCLFVMEIVFKLIKLTRFKVLMMIMSALLLFLAEFVLQPRPIVEPHMLYNVDSMAYYIIFYALGYCLYPYINDFFKLNTSAKKIIYVVLVLITGVYTTFAYEGVYLLDRISINTAFRSLISVFDAIIIIVFILLVSNLLQGLKVLSNIGMETLYLCGNEWIVKSLFPAFISLFGVQVIIDSPLKAWLYSVVLILITYKCVIPIEKQVINIVKRNISIYFVARKQLPDKEFNL